MPFFAITGNFTSYETLRFKANPVNHIIERALLKTASTPEILIGPLTRTTWLLSAEI